MKEQQCFVTNLQKIQVLVLIVILIRKGLFITFKKWRHKYFLIIKCLRTLY